MSFFSWPLPSSFFYQCSDWLHQLTSTANDFASKLIFHSNPRVCNRPRGKLVLAMSQQVPQILLCLQTPSSATLELPSVYLAFSGPHSCHTHPTSGREQVKAFHKFMPTILLTPIYLICSLAFPHFSSTPCRSHAQERIYLYHNSYHSFSISKKLN